LTVFRCGGDLGFFGGNVVLIQVFDLRRPSRNIKCKLIIEIQGLFLKHIERFDILQKSSFVTQ